MSVHDGRTVPVCVEGVEDYTGPVEEYTEEMAAGIGALMPYLDERSEGLAMDRELLEAMVESPAHDQLVAVRHNLVVGAAAMSLTFGPFEGRAIRLGDFVVHPEARGHEERGRRVAQDLWDTMIRWGQARRATNLNFESEEWRTAAHRFYKRNGAVPDEDNVHFSVDIPLL